MQNRKPVILARSADPEAQPQMRRAYTRRQEKPECALVILVGFAAAFALFVWAGLKIADWEIEQEAIGEKGGELRARAHLAGSDPWFSCDHRLPPRAQQNEQGRRRGYSSPRAWRIMTITSLNQRVCVGRGERGSLAKVRFAVRQTRGRGA